jgi:hypothetical protein
MNDSNEKSRGADVQGSKGEILSFTPALLPPRSPAPLLVLFDGY